MEGSEALFSSLTQLYLRRVGQYFNACFPRDTAEDLTQQVFLKLWGYLESGPEQEPDSWKAWLFRVAVNEKNDFLRKKQRMGSTVELEEAEGVPSGRDSFATEEQIAVRQAMAGLAREDRELLVLKSIGFNSREIGVLQGLPDSTVRSRMASARKHFAEALERNGVDYRGSIG